jgi:hypothetical protein
MTRPELLRTAYGDLIDVVEGLSDADSWLPTGCLGWTVRDLIQHHLLDGQRALVALGTPAAAPADTDAVTYWSAWQPGTPQADSQRRAVRSLSGVWSRFEALAATYAETLRAVLVLAGRADLKDVVSTQARTLTVDDLMSTLVVEAAVHHLDLVAGGRDGWGLDRPGPRPGPLREVRLVLDGLLGTTGTRDWDDRRWALVGTGRAAPTAAERAALGDAVLRLPLFG